MDYHLVIVDEAASLASRRDILEGFILLARLCRACGIYFIFSTQNPTVDVIPSHLKANCQARLAFRVAAEVNSRVILDRSGAEDLPCRGRGILKTTDFTEIQVPFLDEDEAAKLIAPYRSDIKPIKVAPIPKAETSEPKGVISIADYKRLRCD